MIIVLDAGALVALERDDRAMWSVMKLAALRSDEVIAPRRSKNPGCKTSLRVASPAATATGFPESVPA